MAKSLTEAARAVLMKEETALAATLKPGSGHSDPAQTLGSATKLADPVVKPMGADGGNLGAAASSGMNKDKSVKSANNPEAMKKPQAEVMEEDVELEEESDHVSTKVELDDHNSPIHAKHEKEFGIKITHPADGKGKSTVSGPKGGMREYLNKIYDSGFSPKNAHPNVFSEELEEEIELSEELESFIDQCIAEGMDEDQIAEAIEENFEFVTEESEAEDVMEDYEVDMSEHVEALLAGEELSEEFQEKAKTIFEAAVKQKVAEELAVLEEAFAATLEEEVSRINEELSSNVDDYLNYVVEQWTAENEVAIEASLRSELTEEFISGLRNLFAEHYIDIPEDKVNVIEEMGNKVAELEEKLNEEIERNVTLSKMLNESKTNEILLNACDGLTDTQAEKLKSLAEGIEYSDANEYAQKVSVLKENYFSTSVKTDNVLDSVEVSSDGKSMISEELNGPMAAYVRTLGKTLPRTPNS